ncbi:DNA polymerase III subunit chi [Variovorax guangxiensis]|uniref:DNA polymerase III subunit chi n=1 Tax=Variovorax guangxiensis TaxID=1775474 RepID=A0A502E1J2_9BURK|nr:DNA polymerase III subunit chi [Variovorax guangxiensis]RZI69263.1 MAG: DNA polymerase III subunit chi [Variovorax sp.]TPG26865.1 DNA polymerase III subunit chi [Variovorax ginsengisoli]TPG30592.1 DNA polymerase III subunit chi [Variovorax guangxiensis]
MTEIDFHFNTPDKVNYACRLLRKAVGARGARVVVVAEPETIEAIDLALWQVSAVDFVAHCRASADPALLLRSPVVLMDGEASASPHQQVLLNLAPHVPPGFERFERLIDIVTDDEQDRHRARARWRHYADRGYAITRHQFQAGAAR